MGNFLTWELSFTLIEIYPYDLKSGLAKNEIIHKGPKA